MSYRKNLDWPDFNHLPPIRAGDGTDHVIITKIGSYHGRNIISKRGHRRTVVWLYPKSMPIGVWMGQAIWNKGPIRILYPVFFRKVLRLYCGPLAARRDENFAIQDKGKGTYTANGSSSFKKAQRAMDHLRQPFDHDRFSYSGLGHDACVPVYVKLSLGALERAGTQ
jgi:hypothetical protein